MFKGDPDEVAKKLYNCNYGAYRLKVIKDLEPPAPQPELEVSVSSLE